MYVAGLLKEDGCVSGAGWLEENRYVSGAGWLEEDRCVSVAGWLCSLWDPPVCSGEVA